MTTKKLRPPQWFKELWAERNRMIEESAELMSVSPDWLRDAKNEAMSEVYHRLPEPTQKEILTIQRCANALTSYALERFRYENRKNQMSQAEGITYNEKTGYLELKNGVFDSLKSFANKMAVMLGAEKVIVKKDGKEM